MSKFRLAGWTHDIETDKPLDEFMKRAEKTLICPRCKQPYSLYVTADPPDIMEYQIAQKLTYALIIEAQCLNPNCPSKKEDF